MKGNVEAAKAVMGMIPIGPFLNDLREAWIVSHSSFNPPLVVGKPFKSGMLWSSHHLPRRPTNGDGYAGGAELLVVAQPIRRHSQGSIMTTAEERREKARLRSERRRRAMASCPQARKQAVAGRRH